MVLSRYLAILLAVALAAYGAAATSHAHAHAYSGFHGVHLADDHHHEGDADQHGDAVAGDDGQSPGDPKAPASDHHESGFHSHAAPQFSPADVTSIVAVAIASQQAYFFDPDRLASKARDESPFKPPRTLL